MLDLTTEQGRYISAALALAAERPWREVTLSEIATRAGASLVGLKRHFASKTDIVSAFIGLVDDEVLSRAPQKAEGQGPRDRLFEVIMSRFDVLEPWKPALRSILKSGPPDPKLVARALNANRWMLEAAGIGTGGIEGAARTAGLASVYGAVSRVWLKDDDPGLARTMAALDRRLARGERAVRRADDFVGGMRRVASALFGAAETMRSRMDEARRGGRSSEPPSADPTPPPTAV